MRELLKNIFSITDYGETHHILRLCGLKIKFPKREYALKKKNCPYYQYKKKNVDITTIPSATGQMREVQLGNLAILKVFDEICRVNNLQYWLDFGTLLGAIRHKGFIPWDDDIDVSMMRDDYNKIIDAFKTTSKNPDIYAEYQYLGKSQTIIKVRHRHCPSLFIDIFPHDYSNEALSKEERILKTKKMQKIRRALTADKTLDNCEKILDRVNVLQPQIIKDGYYENSDIQCGLDYCFAEPVWVYSYDTIFPLKKLEFEGGMFNVVNKPEEYLSEIFGDYMAYPKKIGFGHSAYLKLDGEIEKIRELIKV